MNGYEILNKLGEGSYGAAYLAETENTKSKCVIKEIKVCHLNAKDLEDAKKEVKVLSSLLHEHITQFLDSFEENGSLYIVMEYCAGGDLQTLITNRNGIYFPESRIWDWFIQLGLAVRFIHQQHIIHRDIKTQNVFLTPKGHVKLGDFGIAKVLDKTSDLANTCIGTPYYLSPEMCENKPYSNKSDVWSVGCVLYEIVCLKHAFDAPYMKALILKIVRCTYESPPHQYSRDLKSLIKEIFQKDPKCRPSMNTILSKPFLMKRLSRFASTSETESLTNLMAKVPKRSNLKPSTKTSTIRSRIGISGPASKYTISTSHKQTPTICVPSGGHKSKLSPKFTMFPNCSKYVGNKSNIKPSSRITPCPKSSEIQKKRRQSLSTVYHKVSNSHSRSEQSFPPKQCTSVDRKPSNFNSNKKQNLHDQIFLKSVSSAADKMKDLLVDINKSNLFVDLNLSKQYNISNQGSFKNDINFFNLDRVFINGNKTPIVEKNIHHKVNMLVTEEMIQACQNAHVHREMAYMSAINSSRNSLKIVKLASPNMFENSKNELSTSFPCKDHFNDTTQEVNVLSSSITAFVPPCPSESSKMRPKDPNQLDQHRNGFNPVNENLDYQPFSTPLLDQNCILEIKRSKVDTINSINLLNLYNGRRRWNCEPKNSIIKYFSSAKLSQGSETTESTLLDVFDTPLPLDRQNISFNEVQNKTFNVSSNKANSRISSPVTSECSPKVTKLCEHFSSSFSSSDEHFLHASDNPSTNSVPISNISNFSNRQSGVKSKSRFSSLLKKLLQRKRKRKSSVFKSLYPEFKNVSDRSIIYKESSDANSFYKNDFQRKIESEITNCETMALNKLSKPLCMKERTKIKSPDKDACSAVLNLRNFSNDVLFVSALDLNVNSDLSHTLKNIDISMQHQSDFNMQTSNSASPLIDKCLANNVKGIHSITFGISDNLDSSMSRSQRSYFKGLLHDSSKLSHSAKFPKEIYFSFDQEYSLFSRNKTFSSSLILPPTYLEEIRTSMDSEDITLQSTMLTFPLIHPLDVQYFLSASSSENKSCENQGINHTKLNEKDYFQSNDGQTVINSNSTLSDGETLDVCRLRHSLENILSCTEDASDGSHLSPNDFSDDLKTSDDLDDLEPSDDVHGWIEEQRITLERQIGHRAFIKAYRCLEMAFEEKDYNMDEAILQVKAILGPSKQDFSCKIVELLVTESVYFT